MPEMSQAQIVVALEEIRAGKDNVAQVSGLEEYLLDLLLGGGTEAVGAILKSLEGMKFTLVDAPEVAPNVLFRSDHDENALIVEALAVDDIAAISIAAEDSDGPELPAGHQWFYDRWAHLVDDDIDAPASLEEPDRTVYLIASFEAEVMIGGMGQYLANTDGAFAEETIAALRAVGAGKTASCLSDAVAHKRADESWEDMWARADSELDAITETLMADEDYLAMMTARYFGKGGR